MKVHAAGRAEYADIRLEDNAVSRVHAVLFFDGRHWNLVDCSSNGTFVNGRAVPRFRLQDGDTIRFADSSEWIFATVESGATSTVNHVPRPRPADASTAITTEYCSDQDPWQIVGESESTRAVRRQIVSLARSLTPVLIRGEWGTGRRHAARALHFLGPANTRPFVRVNSLDIEPDDLEQLLDNAAPPSSLSGDHPMEPAPGTIVFEEVSELSPQCQSILAAALDRLVRGGHDEGPTSAARIVAISSEKLEDFVSTGQFDDDLMTRLGVIQIPLDPLRLRKVDIPDFARRFVECSAMRHRRRVNTLTDQALEVLQKHSWPGNVAELKNTIERAVILSRNSEISSSDLASGISEVTDGTFVHEGLSLREMEQRHIFAILESTGWKKSKVAAILGIERSTLDRKIKRYGLSRTAESTR